MQSIIITEDEFTRMYRPIRNHLDPNAAFDWGDGFGTMFETFGNELEFVRSQPANCIWTFISVDGYDTITSGYHWVNRVGYFVCSVPVAEGVHVCVPLEFEG